MDSPAFATARHNAALAMRNAAESFWTALRTTHRDIATTLGISVALHVTLLMLFGAALYTAGEDERDVPELSVQLETREGPSSEEFTEAALPQPAPDPVEEVLDDPGTTEQTLDAPMVADAVPLLEATPDRRRTRARRGLSRGNPAGRESGADHPRRVTGHGTRVRRVHGTAA